MSCICKALQEEKYIKVRRLIVELENLAMAGYADDEVIMAQKYDNGYIYQSVFSVAEYDGESAIGLVGNGLTDDRRCGKNGIS